MCSWPVESVVKNCSPVFEKSANKKSPISPVDVLFVVSVST